MWQVFPPKGSDQQFPVKFSRKGTVDNTNMSQTISHLQSKRLISFFGKQELFLSRECRLNSIRSQIFICIKVTDIFDVKNVA